MWLKKTFLPKIRTRTASWFCFLLKYKKVNYINCSLTPVCLRSPLSRTHLSCWVSWGTPPNLICATNEPSLPLRAGKPWWVSRICTSSQGEVLISDVIRSFMSPRSVLPQTFLFVCRTALISPVWGSYVRLAAWIAGRARWSRSVPDFGCILSCRSVYVSHLQGVSWCLLPVSLCS